MRRPIWKIQHFGVIHTCIDIDSVTTIMVASYVNKQK